MDPELLDKLEKLQVLTLQPGDILVVTAPAGLSQEAAVVLREQLMTDVPEHQVFVMAAGMELAALRTAAS